MNKKRQIYINLPVKNLEKSIAFFTALGFTFNPKFTDSNATCMIISDDIYAMLLVKKFFKTFITKEISDSRKSAEVILAVTAESRDAVNELVNKALAAGGKKSKDPEDHGWMYGWGFQDPDGHLWEVFYMEES
jgi:predicted lactoylglutathione lyase